MHILQQYHVVVGAADLNRDNGTSRRVPHLNEPGIAGQRSSEGSQVEAIAVVEVGNDVHALRFPARYHVPHVPDERVVTPATGKNIRSFEAPEHIVAGAAIENIDVPAAREGVRKRRTYYFLDVGVAITSHAGDTPVGDNDGRGRLRVIEHIVSGPAIIGVVSGTTDDHVVAISAAHPVVAGTANQNVVTSHSRHAVVSGSAVDDVVTIARVDHVGAAIAGDDVITGAADNVLYGDEPLIAGAGGRTGR